MIEYSCLIKAFIRNPAVAVILFEYTIHNELIIGPSQFCNNDTKVLAMAGMQKG